MQYVIVKTIVYEYSDEVMCIALTNFSLLGATVLNTQDIEMKDIVTDLGKFIDGQQIILIQCHKIEFA